MYWSIYDTLVLLSGLIIAAIALIPIPTIETKTRITSAAIGGGLVLLSIILGNQASFRYPSVVMVGPILALVAAGVIAKSALDKKKQLDAIDAGHHDGGLQSGEEGYRVTGPVAASPVVAPSAAATALEVSPSLPASTAAPTDPREAAWRELFDPSTQPERLAEIAAAHPEFAATIAAHPQAYPALKEWAAAQSGVEQV